MDRTGLNYFSYLTNRDNIVDRIKEAIDIDKLVSIINDIQRENVILSVEEQGFYDSRVDEDAFGEFFYYKLDREALKDILVEASKNNRVWSYIQTLEKKYNYHLYDYICEYRKYIESLTDSIYHYFEYFKEVNDKYYCYNKVE